MASTVNSSTHKMSRPMIWLCSYSAGTGPVTPTTWSAGRPRYQRAYAFAPAVCAPNEVPARKYRNVITVVDCSFVPFSRPDAFGSGNAPASPGMPPGGSGVTGSARIRAASPCPVAASAAAAWANWPDRPASPGSCRSADRAWCRARSRVAAGIPCGSRCTTATAASMGKPNSRAASLSARAAAEPGGTSCDSPLVEVALSGGRNMMASTTAATHPPTMRYRRLTTTKA